MERAAEKRQETRESCASKVALDYLNYVTQLIQDIDVRTLEQVVSNLRSA